MFPFLLIQFRPKVQDLTACMLFLLVGCDVFVFFFYGISLECTTTGSLQRKLKERTSQKNTHFLHSKPQHLQLRFIFRSTSSGMRWSFAGFESATTFCATSALACDGPPGDAREAEAGATAALLSTARTNDPGSLGEKSNKYLDSWGRGVFKHHVK